jgi:hypothetical protein
MTNIPLRKKIINTYLPISQVRDIHRLQIGRISVDAIHYSLLWLTILLQFSASQSTAGDEEAQTPVCLDEIPLSQTFKFTMNLQLALIIFLALSWVYEITFGEGCNLKSMCTTLMHIFRSRVGDVPGEFRF